MTDAQRRLVTQAIRLIMRGDADKAITLLRRALA